MANEQQLAILRAGKDAWNAWRGEGTGVGEAIDLSGIELNAASFGAEVPRIEGRVDLSGINLRDADLRGSSISDVNLTGADLSYARLQDAVFANSCHRNVNFDGADMTHCKFWSGSLPGASFWDTVLDQAVFSGADLREANFTNATMTSVNLEGAQLDGAELWRANLELANLGGASLVRANMTEINLCQANLRRCDLRYANLYAARANQGLFDEADLRFADLRRANLIDANVTEIKYNKNARYRGIRVKDCYGSPRFTRIANDQNYIEELRAKEWDPFLRWRGQAGAEGGNRLPDPLPEGEWLYWLWFVSSDCGRSLWRWTLMALALAVAFGGAFYSLGEDAFAFNEHEGKRLTWGLGTMVYYSISIFAKVSTGQVTPVSSSAVVLVTCAGIAGLFSLGGLATILADKVARRA